jgi:hypothetical protein
MLRMPFVKLLSPGPGGLTPMLTPEKPLYYSEATPHLILGVHSFFSSVRFCFDLHFLNKWFSLHFPFAVEANGIQEEAVTRSLSR